MAAISINEALNHIVRGKACLFLGAGFSEDFRDVANQPLPLGSKLTKEMVALSKGRDTKDLRVAATQLLRTIGPEEYVNFLRNRFTVRESYSAATTLAAEKWSRVYTTNFDDGFERAAVAAGRKFLTTTVSDLPEQYVASPRVCVHIHGFVDRISTATVQQDVVLTLPGYASDRFAQSPWKTLLKHDFMAARAIFFVGYSLSDLDIARILQECDPSAADKTFFVIDTSGDTDLEILLEDFGSVVPLGVKGFAERLEAIDRTKVTMIPFEYRAFERLIVPQNPKTPTDADMYKLLMSGFVNEDLILANPAKSGNRGYTVRRTLVEEVVASLSDERRNVFYIFGEFSNGKTVALFDLASELLLKNYVVLNLVDIQGPWHEDISNAVKSNDRIAFIVDDMQLHKDCSAEVIRFIRKGDIAILADRTQRSEVALERLRASIDPGELVDIDVDFLSADERKAFVSLLDQHGLWGDLTKASQYKKFQLIEHDLDNQLRGILLGVLESPDALSRLEATIADIDFKDPEYDGVLFTLVLAVTKAADLRLDLVDDLSGTIPLRRILASSQGARSLLRIRSPNNIRTVSSVVAETVVQHFAPIDATVRCIVNAVQRSQDRTVFRGYRDFPRRIMPFRHIQRLLPASQSKSLKGVETIYDSIKGMGTYSGDPQFWLQYAICQLFLRDFPRAESYFKTAYGCCGPTYDRTFIDNHYARYLLESAIGGPDAPLPLPEAEKRLERVKTLLQPQFKEEMYYPYRVALNLEQFIKIYGAELSDASRDGLGRFIDHILLRAKQAIARGQGHRYIYSCVDTLSRTKRDMDNLPQHSSGS